MFDSRCLVYDRAYRYTVTPMLRALTDDALDKFVDAVMAYSTTADGRYVKNDKRPAIHIYYINFLPFQVILSRFYRSSQD